MCLTSTWITKRRPIATRVASCEAILATDSLVLVAAMIETIIIVAASGYDVRISSPFARFCAIVKNIHTCCKTEEQSKLNEANFSSGNFLHDIERRVRKLIQL